LRTLHVEGGVAGAAAVVAQVGVEVDTVVRTGHDGAAGGVAQGDVVQVEDLFGAVAVDAFAVDRAVDPDQFRAGAGERLAAARSKMIWPGCWSSQRCR